MTRGHDATTPAQIPKTGWFDIAMRVKDEIAEDRVSLLSAGVAFYGMLALFPAISAVMALGGLLFEPDQIVAQIDRLSGLVPDEVIAIVKNQATAVAGADSGGLGFALFLGLAVALYSASKGMASLMQGLNAAYDEEETRGVVRRILETLALTLVLIAGVLVALGAALALPVLLAFLNPGPVVTTLITAGLCIALIALTMLGLSILYRFAPSRESAEWKWVSVGAVTGCLLWIAGSAGFAFYVGNFGSYNESFGTVAGVVVLLMWFWISAFIILLGAELNAEMEAQTRTDTTTGKDRPMGQRGAVKADTVAESQG